MPRLQSTLGGSTILGLALSRPIREQLTLTLPDEVSFHMAECVTEIIALRSTTAAPMMVCELCNPAQRYQTVELLPALVHEELREVLRTLPSVVICRTDQVVSLSALRKLGHVQVVVMDAPRAFEALWEALERALASSIATALLNAMGDIAPPLVRRVMTVALSGADREVFVPEVAAALHMHERMLRRRLCVETGGMSALELIGWVRILRVAWQLEQSERAIMDIANALSFSAASNQHRQVRRYTGETIRALQSGDPVATTAGCFREALQDRLARAGRASEQSPRSVQSVGGAARGREASADLPQQGAEGRFEGDS